MNVFITICVTSTCHLESGFGKCPSVHLEDGQMSDEDGCNKRPITALISTNGFNGRIYLRLPFFRKFKHKKYFDQGLVLDVSLVKIY